MQKNYLVKSPVHFADLGFFVKIGDILVHDTSNANRLTVYRNGEVVKALKQTALGLAAMQKSGFIEEVTQQTSKAAPKAPAKPVEAPKSASKREEPKPAAKPVSAPPKKEEPKKITVNPKLMLADSKPTKLTEEDHPVSIDDPVKKFVEEDDEEISVDA